MSGQQAAVKTGCNLMVKPWKVHRTAPQTPSCTTHTWGLGMSLSLTDTLVYGKRHGTHLPLKQAECMAVKHASVGICV